VDCGPEAQGDEGGGCVGAGEGEEVAAPGRQVVECEGWRACYDAVEVCWEVLGGFEALSSAGRTTQIVALCVR